VLDIAVGFIDDPIRSLANVATPFLAVLSDPLPFSTPAKEPRWHGSRLPRTHGFS